MTTDPFGTAELRSAVLDAWQRSPARFREDANTEEDHATGYYRDRVIVELAQNAADAATRAGVPGRLALRLVEDDHGARLIAANTGAGLDADGVASLASLRASAKTGAPAVGAVGRFGVGFAAVRSVSDDITVASRDGGVRFSLDQATAALADLPALAEQISARGTALPILRLPFPAADHPPASHPPADHSPAGDLTGFDTVVTLILRDAAAVAAVRQQLAAVDDALLLALPALDEVEITDGDQRVLRDAPARWIAVTRTGVVPPVLLASRPVEERTRTGWSVTWAYPRDPAHRVRDDVLHAPTPTDEPLSLPALLLATFPLDPSRRHVAEGDLAQFMVTVAAAAYAELAQQVPHPLDLVPTGLPRGRLDAELCEAVIEELRTAPVFSGRPAADVTVIEGEVSGALVAALAPTGLGVVDVGRRHLAAARRLGAPVRTLADTIDALPDALTPRQWFALYDALAPYADHDRAAREALDAILVPCTDGGTVRGLHGLILSQGPAPGAIEGLRVVHPDAAHPLLRRLGALPDDDPAVLRLPAVEQAVRRAGEDLLDRDVDRLDAPDTSAAPGELAAVIALVDRVVADRELTPADLPDWFSLLPLPGDDGLWQRADELSWPGMWAAEHLDLASVDTARIPVLTEATARVLGARFTLEARLVDPAGDLDLPGWADYVDYLSVLLEGGESADAVWTIADLDVVHDSSWPAVVERLAHDGDLHRAVVTRVRSGAGAGTAREALSYAAWYLRDVFGAPWVLDGSPAGRGSGDEVARHPREDLRVILAGQPADLGELSALDDPELVRALGGVASPRDLDRFLATPDPTAWDGFFAGLVGSPDHDVRIGTAVALPLARVVWTALERACQGGLELETLPEVMIALQGVTARIVAADDVVVTDQPMWAQVRAVVPVTAPQLLGAVADALDCDIPDAADVSIQGGSDDADDMGEPGGPVTREVPDWVGDLVPGVPGGWTEHPRLSVDGREVDWWVTPGGEVHVRAGGPASGIAQACAQVAGRWEARHLLEIALREGRRRADLASACAWDDLAP